MKIYTKTGDKGTSGLYNGERLEKDDVVFEALGTTDELSSNIGLAMAYLEDQNSTDLVEQLLQIQCLLQDIGSNIATPRDRSNEKKLQKTLFDEDGEHAVQLEKWIDAMDAELPRLTKFILPSGGKASASLHVSRSVCRRAERGVQSLVRDQLCDISVGVYLNRLSDYLFNAARTAAHKIGEPERIYTKPA
ncbi:Adenosylcobalamin biosynthesis, ATP:cob(I)alamin adenosyltransferase-like protein [Phycomyces nitens]|nr:Adenosylcobalamin biosynthesis, ATP:cob(I)alamin adenosyltransferase-like protein [Phycomyces nitens]